MMNWVQQLFGNQDEDEILAHILASSTNDKLFHMADNLIEEDYQRLAMNKDPTVLSMKNFLWIYKTKFGWKTFHAGMKIAY